ncbi:hypothetical protein HK103_003475 [Boothiomyces macroporosus]|uniref:MORN repeat-containing protein 3 n=1 Tax=Boothiomyces macroporosus TaxID=261099 RepID=A0AAD5UC24_9FUNG|nr:hypothetical protein HK103_003475 [Boothiomyces macroporosus]
MSSIKTAKHAEGQKASIWKAKDKLSQKNGTHSTIYLINGDRYMGEWKDNLRHGKGTHFYKSSGFQYMGEWQFDKRHGYGILSVPEDLVEKKGQSTKSSMLAASDKPLKEDTKLRKVYTGLWQDDTRHGTGTYFYADGSVYQGMWCSDMRQGWGRMDYKDGSIYEGEWHHEMRHGQGILLLPNGDRYEGMWFDDEKEGPGKFVYLKKRQVYKGEWSKGQPRCGTIQNLPSHGEYHGPKYQMPVLELQDPNKILEIERDLIYQARAKRLVE